MSGESVKYLSPALRPDATAAVYSQSRVSSSVCQCSAVPQAGHWPRLCGRGRGCAQRLAEGQGLPLLSLRQRHLLPPRCAPLPCASSCVPARYQQQLVDFQLVKHPGRRIATSACLETRVSLPLLTCCGVCSACNLPHLPIVCTLAWLVCRGHATVPDLYWQLESRQWTYTPGRPGAHCSAADCWGCSPVLSA